MKHIHRLQKNISKLQSHTQLWELVFHLLTDGIFLALVGLIGLLTFDALLPGFVSSHLNFAKYIFLVGIAILAHQALMHHFAFKEKTSSNGRLFRIFLGIWFVLLLLNSLIKFPLYAIAIIVMLTISIAYLLIKECSPQHR